MSLPRRALLIIALLFVGSSILLRAAEAPSQVSLAERIESIRRQVGAQRIAVAFHDLQSGTRFGHGDAEWFHAASTIKVPVLVAVFTAIQEGRFELESPLHVRNRFLSAADGSVFTIPREPGANAAIHDALGKTLPIADLARAMIVTSSNFATNLLIDVVGLPEAKQAMAALSIEGLDLQRGVADDKAFEAGLNNRATAAGLTELFVRMEEGKLVSPAASRQMIAICFGQQFNSGIPAGIPEALQSAARVAHKTGNISTIAHDTGLVYLPGRKPYALSVLTEWDAGVGKNRMAAIARVTRAVHEALIPAP